MSGEIFLYPQSDQLSEVEAHKLHNVCGLIVRELEARDWHVPGITVKFEDFDDYRMVSTIEGDDFFLRFGHIQDGADTSRKDIAAVRKINIHRTELNIPRDGSGPVLYLYVGENWEAADRHNFIHGIKTKSKFHGKPRTYLRYKGAWSRYGESEHFDLFNNESSGYAPYLVHDNCDGHEYDPEKGEPVSLSTKGSINNFAQWLRNNVLYYIRSYPTAEEIRRRK